ncbi:hypothetical protein [Paenibacillus sp. Marseille-Q4541]|uniref:phage protein n=1 Tax=Paenibacillus sp. Marseille-Q4541 TaxID=2831522 RepID=UPI001BAC6DC0|nr:hypothetical protein [Paenibacillus sp. Marseille-Q4541]
MSNFGRVIEILVGGMKFSSLDFNIEGTVPFDNDTLPNESEVKIWNLSDSTINKLKRNSVLHINAGYTGDIGTILQGYVTKRWSAWDGPNRITTLKVLDGPDLTVRKIVSKAYAKGTLASYILKDLASKLGIPVAQMELSKDVRYLGGYTADGVITEVMADITKDCGTSFFMNKGRIYIRNLRRGADPLFKLSQKTGLIGSPEPLEGDDGVIGYNLRSQLQHRISTASTVDLTSRIWSGRVHVRSGSHKFSRTGDFMTEMEAIM